MKRSNKKGFTIVELIVVIAVIAVLTAVLIPTFGGVIKKANEASDTALAKQMNNAIAISETPVDTFEDALMALRENGFLIANLNAKASGCYFVWEDKTNQIIYIDSQKDFEVIYSNGDYEAIGSTWYLAVSNKSKADSISALNSAINIKMTIATAKDLNTAVNVSGNNTVYIDESISISKNDVIVLDNSTANVTIELGNATVSGNNSGSLSINNIPFQVKAGELNLNGGVISATGDALDADGEKMNNVAYVSGGSINITGSKIEAPGSTITIALSNSTAHIKDTTLIAHDNVIQPSQGSKVILENVKIDCAYLAVFSSNSGGSASEVTIKGGVYTTTKPTNEAGGTNLLGVHGGVIIVEDGTFNCQSADKTFKFYNVAGSKIVLKDGVYNNIDFADLNEDNIKAMINTSDLPDGLEDIKVEKVNGAWEISLK